ncbi:MAG: CoA transferase, partial [Dehalococcoidia bacterium]|nr:CoA transferase [Dehalococcoidia bacterium]
FMKYVYRRAGPRLVSGSGLGRRQLFPCKDGHVAFMMMGGPIPGIVASTRALVAWMAEQNMAPDWLLKFDWAADFDIADPKKFPQEKIDRIEDEMLRFFMTKTKEELYKGAVDRGIILTPVSTAEEVWNHPQLRARDFWRKLDHPELGDSLYYCGGFVKMSDTPLGIRRRAPLIGEHNDEVYRKELRYPKQKLVLLKQAGVI